MKSQQENKLTKRLKHIDLPNKLAAVAGGVSVVTAISISVFPHQQHLTADFNESTYPYHSDNTTQNPSGIMTPPNVPEEAAPAARSRKPNNTNKPNKAITIAESLTLSSEVTALDSTTKQFPIPTSSLALTGSAVTYGGKPAFSAALTGNPTPVACGGKTPLARQFSQAGRQSPAEGDPPAALAREPRHETGSSSRETRPTQWLPSCSGGLGGEVSSPHRSPSGSRTEVAVEGNSSAALASQFATGLAPARDLGRENSQSSTSITTSSMPSLGSATVPYRSSSPPSSMTSPIGISTATSNTTLLASATVPYSSNTLNHTTISSGTVTTPSRLVPPFRLTQSTQLLPEERKVERQRWVPLLHRLFKSGGSTLTSSNIRPVRRTLVAANSSSTQSGKYLEQAISDANAAAFGLVVAKREGQINPYTTTWRKAQSAIFLLRHGKTRQEAARRAGIPISMLVQLIGWGQNRP